MKNLAERIDPRETVLEYCIVVDEGEGKWTVATESSRYTAKKAVGCLVKPEKNDLVLVLIDQGGRSYILSVLERPDEEKKPTTLSFNGETNLEVRGGPLRVSAHDGITLMTPERLAMTSEELEINALKGEAKIESFSLLGRVFSGQIEKVKVIAHGVDTIFRRMVQRCISSYRYVEEHEEIQSASTRMIVDGTLTMQTKNTMHIAEGHVKIDAEQIHLG